MKPLSEFAEELVKSRGFFEVAYRYRHAPEIDQVEVVRRFAELKAHIKEELQAWLRETDVWMRECDKECDELGSLREIWAKKIRNELLGTAQKDL
ncbi:hypothetical protein LCGC14_3161970 [marine sediment metagenome]|uniref:Uncharacterized protein n=1 Tax=marine sediment metagenome TaxID=412755 RepID=A0A0F8VR15_9ZZZZ